MKILIYRNRYFIISASILIVIVIFAAIWQYSYQYSWQKSSSVRRTMMMDYDKAEYHFPEIYGKKLAMLEVIASSELKTINENLYYDFIFYYFATYGDTIDVRQLSSSVGLLEYFLENRDLSKKHCLILICGNRKIIHDLKQEIRINSKYTKFAESRMSIYSKLYLPLDRPAFIVADKAGIIKWCSLHRPNRTTLFQLVNKLFKEKES